jgi:hypothetical protein
MHRRFQHIAGAAALTAGVLTHAVPARAEPTDSASGSPQLVARSETHFQLYRRALLPGPYGAIVTTETALPVVEYANLYAAGIDTPLGKQSLDVDLDLWGSATFGAAGEDRRMDGDIRAANVRYHSGRGWAKLGRQLFAGGAARVARFDGLSAGGTLDFGLGAEAYAGLTVLPRWDMRPGYQQLGATADSLLRDPNALPDPKRSGFWLAGGRLYYDSYKLDAGVSFHEQHEDDEISHRRLGADARWDASSKLSLGGNGNMDVDSTRIADARIYGDFMPTEKVVIDVEASHAEPALFLSRQSVLSVFSTDTYQEAGGSVSVHPWQVLRLTAGAFGQHYSSDDNGLRAELGARVAPSRSERTLLLLNYARVSAVENGYHSIRTSARQRIVDPLVATAEAYFYFYDESIRGQNTSSVFAGTLQYGLLRDLSVMWGGSVARSPYAVADAQTQLRVVYGPSFGAWR